MKGLVFLFLSVFTFKKSAVDARVISLPSLIDAIENSGNTLPDFIQKAKVLRHRHVVCDLSNDHCIEIPNFTNDKDDVVELLNKFKKQKDEMKRVSEDYTESQSDENETKGEVQEQENVREEENKDIDTETSKMSGNLFRPVKGMLLRI